MLYRLNIKVRASTLALSNVCEGRYHPLIQRLVFSPTPELSKLRLEQLNTLPDNTNLTPNTSTSLSGVNNRCVFHVLMGT
jgi:hypothetical protein